MYDIKQRILLEPDTLKIIPGVTYGMLNHQTVLLFTSNAVCLITRHFHNKICEFGTLFPWYCRRYNETFLISSSRMNK